MGIDVKKILCIKITSDARTYHHEHFVRMYIVPKDDKDIISKMFAGALVFPLDVMCLMQPRLKEKLDTIATGYGVNSHNQIRRERKFDRNDYFENGSKEPAVEAARILEDLDEYFLVVPVLHTRRKYARLWSGVSETEKPGEPRAYPTYFHSSTWLNLRCKEFQSGFRVFRGKWVGICSGCSQQWLRFSNFKKQQDANAMSEHKCRAELSTKEMTMFEYALKSLEEQPTQEVVEKDKGQLTNDS